MRQLALKYGQIQNNEHHTTDDKHRDFLDQESFLLSPAVFHGSVATTARMITLNVSSRHGCMPNDWCYNEETRCGYVCVDNNGESEADWLQINQPIPIIAFGDTLVGDEDGEPVRLGIGTEGQIYKVIDGKIGWGNMKATELTVSTTGGEVLLGRSESDAGAVQEIELGAYLSFFSGKLIVSGLMPYGEVLTNPGVMVMNGATAPGFKDGKLAGRASDGSDDVEEIACIPPLHCWLDPLDGPRLQLIYDTNHFESVAGAAPATDGFTFSLKLAPPTKGGTGLSSYVKGDVLYASATDVLSALAGATTDGWVFTWNNTSKLPEWRASSGGGGGGADFLTVQVFS